MRALIALVLRARVLIVALAALFLLAGSLLARRVPLDVLPDFAPPQVVVQTEAPGLDPERVEQLVTRPVEAALNASPDLQSMRSESIAGLSAVTLNFADGSDPYRVWQGVAERVPDAIPSLPAGVSAPRLEPLTSATMDVLKIGLLSERLSAMELRIYAQTIMRPALLAVPGVARVLVFGGEQPQIDIAVDSERLLALGITLETVTTAAQRALAPTAAGFLETDNQRFAVKLPAIAALHDLEDLPLIQRGARTVRLAEVARIAMTPVPAFGDALVQGRPGVLVEVSGQFGAHTLDVTRAVEARLAELTPGVAARGIQMYPALHRPASFLIESLTNLRNALVLGGLFVSTVLLLVLRSPRAALTSFLAIPLSLLPAALILQAVGYTLNTMTLGGFALALGVLMDDAIIDVENIMQRLRAETRGNGLPGIAACLRAVLEASLEIRGPMVYATIVVLLVFVPVVLLPGVEGRFVAPLAWAFVLAVLASLGVALTITPALAAMLLANRIPPGEPRWIDRLRALQRRSIARVAGARRGVVAVLAVVFVVVVGFALRIPAEFLPAFRESHFVVQVEMRQPGVSLATMRALGQEVSRRLLALPFVATVALHIGRAEQGEDTWPIDLGEFHIALKQLPGLDQGWAQAQIREVMRHFPGLDSDVVTFLEDRLSETITGEASEVVIGVYGDDLDAIDAAAARIAQAVEKIDGVTDLHAAADARVTELRIVPQRAALAAYAIDASVLAPVFEAMTQGIAVGTVQTAALPLPVVVTTAGRPGEIAARLAQELVPTGSDGYVPFATLASLERVSARSLIRHEAGRRYTVVGFNVSGRSIQSVTDAARAAVAHLGLPASIEVSFGGEGEAARAATRSLFGIAAITLALVVGVLLIAFRQRRHAALVLLNLPFSLIGALGTLLLLRLPLTLGAAVGLVTVFGISARNAILLLSHYEELCVATPMTPAADVALKAAGERLVPILITALVAGLGLAPLAIGLGHAGYEIEAPLAIVVLGGLATSTVLSLVLLPALVARNRRGVS